MYLINIVGTTIISIISSLLFICILKNYKITKICNLKNILIILLFNILFALNLIYMQGTNKILCNLFIVIMLYVLVFFNYDYKKSIFYGLLFMTSTFIIEIITGVPFLVIFGKEILMFKFNTLLFSIFNSGVLLVISFLPCYKKMVNFLVKVLEQKNYSFFILIFVCIYTSLLCYSNVKLIDDDINSIINLFFLVFIMISIVIINYNTIKRAKTEDKYNQMMEYVSKYEKIINEQGKRNHEFNNQLMVLQGYIDDKEKLKEYLNLIMGEQRGGQDFRIKQLGYLPNGGFKGLLYYKLSKMEEKNIKSFLYIEKNVKNFLKDFSLEFYKDITKIFGVFIDNAIEAAEESEKKEVEIDIRKDKDSLIIDIANTFNDKANVNKIGSKGYSTKGKGHGFGLSIVKDIKIKNDNIDTFLDIENDMFKQTLIIYLK